MIALDVETVWSKQYSVATMGLDRYVKHPDFRVTIVSLVSDDGFEWVGDPRDLPVDRLNGQSICAHNAEFDSVCCRMAMARGQMPQFTPKEWICTADMASWHQLPRSLAGCHKELFGEELNKDARNEMSGLRPEEILGNESFKQYALGDSRACIRIYNELKISFPEKEFLLSAFTRRTASRGMAIDQNLCQQYINKTEAIMKEVETFLPWVGPGGGEPTSTVAMAAYLKMQNVEPPKSTQEGDSELLLWKAKNPQYAPILEAMTRWRKANKARQTYISMILRVRPDHRVSTRLKYCGAPHTGRWSGAGGLNFQGIPRDEVEGTSAKKCLTPGKGRVMVSADLSQIEPRVLAYLCGDFDFLGLVRGGIDLYEAHGRATGLYNEDEPMKDLAPELRHLCKARVLGLGYGCGPKKFGQVAQALTGGKLNMTDSESRKQVKDFRNQNPKIVELWKKCEDHIREEARQTPECATMICKSGKPIRYFDVKDDGRELTGQKVRGQGRMKLYGGLLLENLVQATARELMADSLLKIEAAGLPVVLHVHDSVTVEVAESEGQAALDLMIKLLTEEPLYMPGLPLAAEGEIKTHY